MVAPYPEKDKSKGSQQKLDVSEIKAKIWREHLANKASGTFKKKLERVECDS